MGEYLTTPEVARHCRVSYKQVEHWVRVGYLHIADARPGSGTKRQWSPAEVRVAEVFAALVHAGVGPHTIAEALPTALVGDGWFAVQLGALTVSGPLL